VLNDHVPIATAMAAFGRGCVKTKKVGQFVQEKHI
jgi:hypothetical protein